MAEKVAKLGLKRNSDYLLYVKGTKVWAAKRRKKGSKGASKKIAVASFAPHKPSTNYIYFVDKSGDVSRSMRANVKSKKSKKRS
jgi:hypothetical protein